MHDTSLGRVAPVRFPNSWWEAADPKVTRGVPNQKIGDMLPDPMPRGELIEVISDILAKLHLVKAFSRLS